METNAKTENGGFCGGFTLVEMLVAVALFIALMVIAMGALLRLVAVNDRAKSLKTVVNNLHFAFENMSRNLRTGTNYRCNASWVPQGGGFARGPAAPGGCTSEPVSAVAFTAHDGKEGVYSWNGKNKAIERSFDDGATFVPITAPEIKVERLQFYVAGTEPNDCEQPRVLISASGFMAGRRGAASAFDIETMVSQRFLDIEPPDAECPQP